MEVINVWLRELKYNGTLKTWMRHFHVLFWTICQVKSKSGKWVYAQKQYSHYGENDGDGNVHGDVNETQGNVHTVHGSSRCFFSPCFSLVVPLPRVGIVFELFPVSLFSVEAAQGFRIEE